MNNYQALGVPWEVMIDSQVQISPRLNPGSYQDRIDIHEMQTQELYASPLPTRLHL